MNKKKLLVFALVAALAVFALPIALAGSNDAKDNAKTVSGELIRDESKIEEVASNGLPAAEKAVDSDMHILIENEEGYVLIEADSKIKMMDTITKVRAKGALNDQSLDASLIEGYCSESEKWHTLYNENA